MIVITNSEIDVIKDIIVKTVTPERIYLFGSYVYGTPNVDSDYDIYVIVPDGSDRPLLLTERIYSALFANTGGKPIDVLVKRVSDFEARKTLPTIEREVSTKGILLYGAS
jgi:predicted nucleotidyltransferase